MTMIFLDQTALSEDQTGAPGGGICFTLMNFSDQPLNVARFHYTGVMRPLAAPVGQVQVTGGRFLETHGSYTCIAVDAQIAPGGQHEITLIGMAYPAQGRSRGAISAWVDDSTGAALSLEIGDVAPPEPMDASPPALPAGQLDLPLGLLPWPSQVTLTDWAPVPHRYAPADATMAAAMAPVAALHRRLFPTDSSPFLLVARPGTVPVAASPQNDLPEGGYTLRFGENDGVTLQHSDADGLRHGLITLAQIGHAAFSEAAFAQPLEGTITDQPRFGWRGCHLDVARSFFGVDVVKRLLDIMAWLKLNRFHWHATEDEAWRFPSTQFQGLNALGNERSPGSAIRPQYGDGPNPNCHRYTAEDVAAVIAHASDLGIDVMPEIEVPGHATALLSSVEGLRDPQEPEDSYRSVQGFANNALNPALDRSYEVVDALLRETADMFPGDVLHIGSDEVQAEAWQQSPAAQALAKAEGLENAMELQAHFLRRVQGMLGGMGKTLGGWDECAEGGGIAPDNTILFAWRTKEKMAELIARGYNVVATPGQAYYLDMIQRGGWEGFGICWAGLADPQSTYAYDPGADLPDGPGALLGVQACIWTEYLPTVAHLNAMVFPRLTAIAEAGWTAQSARDWSSFCARQHLAPRL